MDWISVKDRLPELYDKVLVYWEDNESQMQCIDLAYREPIENEIAAWAKPENYLGKYHITHWMPIPESPKDGKK